MIVYPKSFPEETHVLSNENEKKMITIEFSFLMSLTFSTPQIEIPYIIPS